MKKYILVSVLALVISGCGSYLPVPVPFFKTKKKKQLVVVEKEQAHQEAEQGNTLVFIPPEQSVIRIVFFDAPDTIEIVGAVKSITINSIVIILDGVEIEILYESIRDLEVITLPPEFDIDETCSNITIYKDTGINNNQIKLKELGYFKESDGRFGSRWVIENGKDYTVELRYEIPGRVLSSRFTLEPGESVYFTSGFYINNNDRHTMKLYLNNHKIASVKQVTEVTDLVECGIVPSVNDEQTFDISCLYKDNVIHRFWFIRSLSFLQSLTRIRLFNQDIDSIFIDLGV